MQQFSRFVLSLLVMSLSTACSAEPMLEEGEWEITSQMEMSGMPEGVPAIPPMTYRHCLTHEMMVPAEQQNQDCDVIEQTVSGNTVSWQMRCTSNGVTSEMRGSSSYSGDSMQGTMQVVTQGMEINSQMSGRRLGPCR